MFSPDTIQAMMEHARADYPRESCGLVIDGEYLPRKNSAEFPEKDFKISPQAVAAADRKGCIQAVVHSHPSAPAYPSRADMIGQIKTDLIWGIVPMLKGWPEWPFFWGGNTPIPPLVGREFRSGVTDCYALVRDWYRLERGLALPEYARSFDWWQSGENMFMENFKSAGFEPVEDKPRKGDVALIQVRSAVVNHCGLILDNGLMMHHLSNRLSGSEPLGRWQKYVRMIVRKVAE